MQSKECLADRLARSDHGLEYCNGYCANDGSHWALKVNVDISLPAIPAEMRAYFVT